MFILAGGPGQSHARVLAHAGRHLRAVLADRHVVLLDQRGTGASNHFDCPTPKDIDPLMTDIDPQLAAAAARDTVGGGEKYA